MLVFATHMICICYFYIAEIDLRKVFWQTKTTVYSQVNRQEQVEKRVSVIHIFSIHTYRLCAACDQYQEYWSCVWCSDVLQ